MPNRKKLKSELVSLERRRGKSGKDIIDHMARLHDDRANVVAGLAHLLGEKSDLVFPELMII